ncbi:MAG TPA: NYN domain-containing protein [Kineosporiaceae bacterium]
MDIPPIWGGVDWFGCDDDLSWERLDAPDPATPARRLLILDVENVCPSSRRQVRAMTRLRAVLRAAGPVDRIVAASAASQHTRLDSLLRRAGVHVHTRCGNRPNAADRALIQAARRFAQEGDCEVVVASNDHYFRAVADLPGVRRVVLITQPRLATARALVRVADELRVA